MLSNQNRWGIAVTAALCIACASVADAALVFTADIGEPGDSFGFREVALNNPGNLLIGTSLTGQTIDDITVVFEDMEHLEVNLSDDPEVLLATLHLIIDAAGSGVPPFLTGGSLDDMNGDPLIPNDNISSGQDPFAPGFDQSYTLTFDAGTIVDGDLFHGVTFEGITLRSEPGDVSIIGLELSLTIIDDSPTIPSRLVVGEWVPTPAALPAGAIGLLAIALRRRRG